MAKAKKKTAAELAEILRKAKAADDKNKKQEATSTASKGAKPGIQKVISSNPRSGAQTSKQATKKSSTNTQTWKSKPSAALIAASPAIGVLSTGAGVYKAAATGVGKTLTDSKKTDSQKAAKIGTDILSMFKGSGAERKEPKNAVDRTSLASTVIPSKDSVSSLFGVVGKTAELATIAAEKAIQPLNSAAKAKKTLTDVVMNDSVAKLLGFDSADDMAKAATTKMLSATDGIDNYTNAYNQELAKRGGAVKTAGEVGQAVGQMGSAMAVGLATKKPQLALGALSASAGGSAAKQAIDEGASLDEAYDYGLASGVKEYAIERMFGGIPGLGTGALGSKLAGAVRDASLTTGQASKLAKAAQKTIETVKASPKLSKVITESGHIAGESVEEVVADVVDPIIKQSTYDPDAPAPQVEELLHTALVAGLATAVLRGGVAGGQKIVDVGVTPTRTRIADTQSKAEALNTLSEGLMVRYRPDPLQITDHLTDDDLTAYYAKIMKAKEKQEKFIKLKYGKSDVEIRPNTEPVTNGEPASTALMQKDVEFPEVQVANRNKQLWLDANEEYTRQRGLLNVYYGTKNFDGLTPEQKDEARMNYGIDLDEATSVLEKYEAQQARRQMLIDDVKRPAKLQNELTETLNRIEQAQKALAEAKALARTMFGTSELNAEQMASFEFETGQSMEEYQKTIEDGKDQIEEIGNLFAKYSGNAPYQSTLRKAIANGDAHRMYPERVINTLLQGEADRAEAISRAKAKEALAVSRAMTNAALAQERRRASDELQHTVINVGDDGEVISGAELIQQMKQEHPELSDAQIMELYVVYKNLSEQVSPELQEFIDTQNSVMSEYGITVDVIPQAQVNENEEGYYDPENRTIYLNPNIRSYGVASFVLAHEVVHHAVASDPQLLTELRIGVKAAGIDLDGIKARIEKAYPEGENTEEEAIAIALSRIMNNDELLSKVSATRSKIWDRVKEAISETFKYSAGDRITRRNKRLVIQKLNEAIKNPSKPNQTAQSPQSAAERPGVRSTDAKGNSLSRGQQKFFSNSKAVNSDGALDVYYQGSTTGGLELQSAPDKTTDFGEAYYLTGNANNAWEQYNGEGGNSDPVIIEAYLNAENPVIMKASRQDGAKFVQNSENISVADFVESLENVLEDYEEQYVSALNSVESVLMRHSSTGETVNAATLISEMRYALSNLTNEDGTPAAPDALRKALEDMGYDGVLTENGAVVFSANSLRPTTEKRPQNLKGVKHLRTISIEDAFKEWELAQERYGTKAPGMSPRVEERANEVPEQIDDDTRVSDFARTVYESPNTPQEWLDPLKLQILSGTGSYVPLTDAKAQSHADNLLSRKGFNQTLSDWNGRTKGRKGLDKYDIVLGERLLVEAADRGDLTNWEDIVGKLCSEATKAGQALQAFSLLKKMSPQGRLAALKHSIATMQNEMNDIRKDPVEVIVPPELEQQLLESKTPEEVDAAEEAIIKVIAEQIPPTVEDRITAWRYLAMLGNPRTHVRNIFSNLAMAIERKGKDTLGATMESMAIGNKGVRTKTLRPASAEVKAFAKNDFNNMKQSLQMGGHVGFDDMLRQYRKRFGGSVFGTALNYLDQMNSGALEKEDAIFMGIAYRSAMQQYLTANNITVAELTEDTKDGNRKLAEARAHATQECLKATYRDASALATALNRFENTGLAAKLLVGGLAPFKRTPINILKRGARYSPLGILKSLTQETYQLKHGKISINEYLDNLSAGLVGSASFALGIYLAMQGVIQAGGADDEREQAYNEMLGNQQYSVTIAGKTYTVDWLTPVSMPLLAGVEYVQATAKTNEDEYAEGDSWLNDGTVNRVFDSLLKTADPLTELSILQGINNAMSGFAENRLGASVSNTVEGYASQFVPTLSGQLTRVMDPVRRSTYAPKDSTFPVVGQEGEKFVNKIQNKSLLYNLLAQAGVTERNEPYVDQWGREETRDGNAAQRVISQTVAPYYEKRINRTSVDDRLSQIQAVNGRTDLLPNTPRSYVDIAEKTYPLKPAEYTQFKKTQGQLSYAGLDSLFSVDSYSSLPQDKQEDMISRVYSYSADVAKRDFAQSRGIEYTMSSTNAKAQGAIDAGLDLGKYMMIMYDIDDSEAGIKGDKRISKTGREYTVTGSKPRKVYNYLMPVDIPASAKDYIYYTVMGYKHPDQY